MKTKKAWQEAYACGRWLFIQKNYNDAIKMYKSAAQLNPEAAEVYHDLGAAMYQAGRYDEALDCFESARSKDQGLASVWYNGATTLCALKRFTEAVTWYQQALQLVPDFIDAHFNLANTLKTVGRHQDAMAHYLRVLDADPIMPEAYNNLGTLLLEELRFKEAMAAFEKAIALKPDYGQAFYNAGLTLNRIGQIDRALVYIRRCLQLQPDHGDALALLMSLYQQTCRWQALEQLDGRIAQLTERQLKTALRPSESPFLSFARSVDTRRNLQVARAWSRWVQEKIAWNRRSFDFSGYHRNRSRLTIGYLSEHFRNAATAHLINGVFSRHNRSRFKIVAYSWGPDDGSFYRRKIERDVDLFVEIGHLSNSEAAERIYADRVDILVDLMGWMQGNRMGILAYRPAPVQVHYLGYPATTGADYIDYMLADKIVIPPQQQQDYAEKIIYLPDCYQVTDNETQVGMLKCRRSDFNLPQRSFIFCSFNTDYKIDRNTFGLWLRILHAVDDSILWLLVRSDEAKNNLYRATADHGIEPHRLVFASPLPKAKHLARLKLADLALDTLVVNGHTTTSDALWAGVPVVTCQGDHFASRVASSILHAIGLSELVTYSQNSYESLAVALANNPERLKKIKRKLENNKTVYPLFKIDDFVRELESAYQHMWDMNCD